MANKDISSLIAGLQIDDPKLYQVFKAINDRVGVIEEELFPLVRQAGEIAEIEGALSPPATFSFAFTPLTVRFTWSSVEGAATYEIRKGLVWETANFQLRTSSLQADIDPLLVGTHNYLIKTVTNSNVYSVTATALVVTVPVLGTPLVTNQVIDNNVLLRWTTPDTSFSVAYYILRRADSEIGQVNGNFTVYFEIIGGDYVYSLAAVDVAGNEGPRGITNVTLRIPADFVLESFRVSGLGTFTTSPTYFLYLEVTAALGDVNFRYAVQSGFEAEVVNFYYAQVDISSTFSNVLKMDGPALLACWTATTFQVHFTGNAWLTPKNQVDAGFPIYIQPAALTGYFEEIYDYGGTFTNIIVTIGYTGEPLTVDGVTVLVRMSVSTDGISYSAFSNGASQFFAALRFLKFRLEFTNSTTKALLKVSNVTISLNVKKELDSGVVTAVATDVGGTQVNFTKAFKDIESITLTVGAKEPVIAIYDFVDIPNPVGFKVFALDSSGNRITYPISWKARGVI
jgi:hypothetical protein